MSADPPPLVVVDTNVLLAATDLSRDHHGQAVAFLTTDERYLAVTPQIMREYLAVMTRPLEANGLGMTPSEALDNADEILSIARLLGDGAATTLRLMELVAAGPANRCTMPTSSPAPSPTARRPSSPTTPATSLASPI